MPNEIEENSVLENSGKKKWITLSILILVNLLNYIDRYTIVGVMYKLSAYFNINDSQQGLLQTVFIVFYMIFAPLFGYLGDRYNRKMLMIAGISVWILAVFASSFCGEEHYYLFMLCRGVVGIGEASYSTIAPTVLSDLFHGGSRSRVLMMFYFAIPVGSGLGFMTGSKIALLTDSWQWGVRFSPIIGIACLLLMFLLLEEPVRGACDGARQNADDASWWDDCKYLFSVKSFCLVTVASIASLFSIGTLSWWTPSFIQYSKAFIQGVPRLPADEISSISTMFGIITCTSGLFGVTIGSMMSRAWKEGKSIFKNHKTEKADVYICAISMFISLPFLFTAIVVAAYSTNVSLILIFFAILSMCLNWAINVDVLMYVVVANRRASALAVQTMLAHMFGDAASPYVIGALSDHLRGDDASSAGHFYALQTALYVPTFVLIIAGAFYLAATFHVEEDRKEALFQMDAPDNWRDPNDPEDMDALLPETVEGREEQPAEVIHSINSNDTTA